MNIMQTASITEKDAVSIHGRYLTTQNGKRFFLKGIGFPIANPPPKSGYDVDAWKAVLDQLVTESKGSINTVRIYDMDCREDYSEFLEYAQNLGIYVLVPLTAIKGGGVLARDIAAPRCYPKALFDYGSLCLRKYSNYPNVLAGVIGNEVMNDLESWKSAPCLLAYTHDLKLYSQQQLEANGSRRIPLLYATQNDAIGGPAIPASKAMKLIYDYLTCHKDYSIDIFGINIESWCSSLDTFESNEDGTEGSYHELHTTLANVTIPLVFSEMGCSKEFFNRENGLSRYVRDWSNVPIVLNEMSDTFSGFVAYAYDGNPQFDMMEGGPWHGHKVLKPGEDFLNFVHQLESTSVNDTLPDDNVEVMMRELHQEQVSDERQQEVCQNVINELSPLVKNILQVDKMPSRLHQVTIGDAERFFMMITLITIGIYYGFTWWQKNKRQKVNVVGTSSNADGGIKNYQYGSLA